MKAVLVILACFLPYVLFAFLFWWLRRSARRHGPKQQGSALEFSLVSGMRFLLGTVLILLAAFTITILIVAVSQEEGRYAALIPLAVLLALLSVTPQTVKLDHDGIRQRRWFRADRTIAWSEVAWIKRGRRTGATYVKSKNGGRPISFSPLMVGQSRFEREVRAHVRGHASLEDD